MTVPTPARWRKSSYSGGEQMSECVEIAAFDTAVGVRDSKNPKGPHLTFSRTETRSLFQQIKSGRHSC